jgi:hypothetical protein
MIIIATPNASVGEEILKFNVSRNNIKEILLHPNKKEWIYRCESGEEISSNDISSDEKLFQDMLEFLMLKNLNQQSILKEKCGDVHWESKVVRLYFGRQQFATTALKNIINKDDVYVSTQNAYSLEFPCECLTYNLRNNYYKHINPNRVFVDAPCKAESTEIVKIFPKANQYIFVGA